MSAKPTAMMCPVSAESPRVRRSMVRRVAAWTCRRQTNSSSQAMVGTVASAMLTNSSAARTVSPSAVPRAMVPMTSASAMRTIDEPMTRDICRAVSTSAIPTRSSPWKSRTASMSMSVKAASSSPTSRKPRARQNRRSSSSDSPVSSDTSRPV